MTETSIDRRSVAKPVSRPRSRKSATVSAATNLADQRGEPPLDDDT